MKFKNVAEAFNYYRNKSVAEMEQRAQAINNEIDSDANADIEALNIELRGIKEAKENAELRSGSNGFTPIGGRRSFGSGNENGAEEPEATAEYRSAFLKTLLGRQLNEAENAAFNSVAEATRRAAAFTATTDAAAVIPTETLNEVIRKARTMGGLIDEARAFNMPSKISIPIGTPSTKAAWHTEGATVDAEKVSPSYVTFEGNEIIKVLSISAKVKSMSIPAFEAYLTDELAACVLETIADSLVNGTGAAGTGKGLAAETLTTVTAAATGIKYADVVSTVAKLKRGYSMGAKWAMNNSTLYNVFYGMVDTNNRPIFIADPQNQGVGKILGKDVIVDDHIADDVIYFGDFAHYLAYNMPNGIAIEVSNQSSFRSGLIDYRALAIADTKAILPEAFVKLTKAAAA